MGMFDRTTLNEHEVAAARDLFDRIVVAEAAILTPEQIAAPGEYLLSTWRRAAHAIMHPLHSVEQLAAQLQRQREIEKELDESPF